MALFSCENSPTEPEDIFVPYLGQEAPGNTPVLFAPYLIDSTEFEIHSSLSFSPDGKELYYSLYPLEEVGKQHVIMYLRMMNNGEWTDPEVVSFSGYFSDDGPFITPDGKKIFYCSNRPLDGQGDPKPMLGWDDHDIWYVERNDSTWSDPIHAGDIINTDEMEIYPSVSSLGNIYYGGYVLSSEYNMGFKASYYENGQYTTPVILEDSINSPNMDWCPYVAPDESYLIFSSKRIGGGDWGDLYISFRKSDNEWYEPINMGNPVNTSRQEKHPSVSPDGEYLFFVRHEYIYWMKSDVIDDLRQQVVGNGEG
jgi:Tol biopolymer transport system component